MNLQIADLLARYRSGADSPVALLSTWLAQHAGGAPDPAWIFRVPAAQVLATAARLEKRLAAAGGDVTRFPLYGVPFAVKDNIDVKGMPTTAACPAFSYVPEASATVVERLEEAGAILVGKTNLDQFATGLVGTRSPYGAVPNSFRPEYVSGGSSSGSASLVARGIVGFSLGTDTAGSGRVPAGFNNIVGLKPTRGRISTRGLLPACRSLDCISVFALTVADAQAVLQVAGGYDEHDPYSRPTLPAAAAIGPAPRLGVPRVPEFFGDARQRAAFDGALVRARSLGATLVEIDFAPLQEAAALLYQGPWVAERYAAIEALMRDKPEVLDPTVRSVIAQAERHSAVDAFKAQYRLEELRRMVAPIWSQVDALMVPTSPTIHTIAEVNADPVTKNSHFGTYTNFVNLLDLAAIAVPDSMRDDGLPAGVTFIAPAWADGELCALGARWHAATALPLGATGLAQPALVARQAARPGWTRVAVVGAHLSGMPLNHQLTSRGAQLVSAGHTAAKYRLFALAGTVPPKPGLQRVPSGGVPIAIEIWEMPGSLFGAFVEEIPPPLGIGTLELADGGSVKGFICEPAGIEGAQDISHFGGWRAYMAQRA
jgi:allophanate hydrolase